MTPIDLPHPLSRLRCLALILTPGPAALPCLLALLCALGVSQAPAADRALLVGVGHYRDAPAIDLKGIDIDLGRMRTVARQLGFAPAETRVLSDADATLTNVTAALANWVRTGVGPDDQVLIYFSTHGTQVPDLDGDEGDNADEALVMYDVRDDKTPDGSPTLANVLIDDDLEQALAAIPSRQVLLVVDACHSGTITRNLKLRSLRTGTDDEESLATPRGSLFTQALAQAIARDLDTGTSLTPREAQQETTALIASVLTESEVFHPRLGGAAALFDKPLRLVHTNGGQGPNWDTVQARAKAMTPLTMQANRQTFRPGERLELTIEIPQDGYLNLVGIDPEDHAIVAFPNRFHPENRVQKGQVRIPGTLGFERPAQPPYGPTLLAAFVTDQPLNLFETSDGLRDAQGLVLDQYPPVSYAGLRGFPPRAPGAPANFAATIEVRICPAAGCP